MNALGSQEKKGHTKIKIGFVLYKGGIGCISLTNNLGHKF